MDALKQIVPFLISGSLAGLVLAIGLDCTLSDLGYLLRRPAKLARAVLVISVLTPAAAVILISILPLQPVTKAGVVLLSISPVPPFVPGRDRSVGGSREYVYGLFAAFALLAILIVPASVQVLNRIFGVDVFVRPLAIAKLVATSVLIPLVIGLVLRRLAPSLAERAAPIIIKLSLAVLGLAAIPLLIKLYPVFGALVGDGTIIACVLFALAALAFGHFLGEVEPGNRAALAIAAGTRHPGIAILVANAYTSDKRVSAAALLCFLICFVVTMVYQFAARRRIAAAPAGPTAPS
jgi:BASS family bile acid:Na+ symporter